MLYLLWNLAQHDRFGKNTERKFSWENVEIDLITDEKNNLKPVQPIPLVSQESVHAKPQRLPLNLAEIANIWDKLPAANIPHLLPNPLLIFVSAKVYALGGGFIIG